MKSFFPAVVLSVAAVSCGCTSAPAAVALDPIGPPILSDHPADIHGALLVFSAFATGIRDPFLPDDINQHSDYEIRTADGTLLEKVHNLSGPFGQDPLRVELPPGRYQLVARSNGSGLVTVPVEIVAQEVTALHLDGMAFNPGQPMASEASLVRLPNGQVVGWRADAAKPKN